MRRFLWLLAVTIALGLPGAARAQDDKAVALPPFIVEEMSKGPPWRYGEMPGFEILSRCSDRTTRELSLAHYRLHRLLELLLPERLQLTFAIPRTIIFYDEELQSAASQEVIASMLKRATKNAAAADDVAPVDFGRSGRRTPLMGPGIGRQVNFLPNLRLWDRDAMMVFAIVRDGSVDADRLVLTADYVNYLLANRTPTLPWWFMNAVVRLYDRTDYETNGLSLRPITWISDEVTAAVRRDPKTAPAPLPLAEFFAGVPAGGTPEGDLRRQIWLAQGPLFVRWALDGRSPEQREAFWNFVDRAGEVTPESFQRGLGLDLAAADAALAAYLPAAIRKTITLRPAHPLKPPVIELRNASDGEIARLKGDWERLEVGFVRKSSPEIAGKYLEQARRTLRHAYDRDVRDPRLLAAMGLCECDAGDDAAARAYLEEAARLGPLRPRADYELARLRFAEAGAHPAGRGGRLSAEQIAAIFTPLFAARAQVPAQVEVYELIAQVWTRAEYRPTRGHLDVLEDGVRLFPRRASLVYQAAALYADYGFAPEAAELVRLGLLVAKDTGDRERFTQLETRLAAAAK